jgi:hypothetical protein
VEIRRADMEAPIMEYVYYIRKRKNGEPPISIIEIKDHEPGDYVTISFSKDKQIEIKSDKKEQSDERNPEA